MEEHAGITLESVRTSVLPFHLHDQLTMHHSDQWAKSFAIPRHTLPADIAALVSFLSQQRGRIYYRYVRPQLVFPSLTNHNLCTGQTVSVLPDALSPSDLHVLDFRRWRGRYGLGARGISRSRYPEVTPTPLSSNVQ